MLDELMVCSCCRRQRKSEGQPPRIRIPLYMGDDLEPLYLCEFCDGDALRNAKEVESKRLAGE